MSTWDKPDCKYCKIPMVLADVEEEQHQKWRCPTEETHPNKALKYLMERDEARRDLKIAMADLRRVTTSVPDIVRINDLLKENRKFRNAFKQILAESENEEDSAIESLITCVNIAEAMLGKEGGE